MEKRLWDKIGIKTSLLGFGAMRLKTINGEIDEELGFKLIDIAIKNGVNYFDTAYPYTNKKNETFVGKALKRYERSSFYLATKFSLFCFETKEEALKSIDMQLNALQTDYIDFYLVHALNAQSFQKMKDWNILEVLEGWKKENKIKHIGFSFHDSYEVFKEIVDYYDWEFAQIQLNYMDTNTQQGIQGYYDLEKKGIPVIIMEPLKGGKLVSFNSSVKEMFDSSKSVASYALRYCGSFDGVKVILSGMKSESDLYDNLNTFKNFQKLSEDEFMLLDNVKEKLESIIKVNCTDCKYCLPCPSSVNIPSNFKMFNSYSMYENKDDLKWNYNVLKNKNELFTNCVECTLCLDKCPQQINIIEEFKKMSKEINDSIN